MNPLDLMKQAAERAKRISTEESDDIDLSVTSDVVTPSDSQSDLPVTNNESISLDSDLEAVHNTENTPQSVTSNAFTNLNTAMEQTDSKIEQSAEFDEIEAIGNFATTNALPTPTNTTQTAEQVADSGANFENVFALNASKTSPKLSVEPESESFGVERQEYFSGEGLLSNNKTAERVRGKLDNAREAARILELSEMNATLPSGDNPEIQKPSVLESSEQLDPLAQTLYAASTLITAPINALVSIPDAISNKWKDWQSKEKKFARYNAKSTKAMRNSMDDAAAMIFSGDKFTSACRDAKIKHTDITRENYRDILSGLGDKGGEVEKTFSDFSKRVVKHEESLIKLDEMTTAALASGTMGINSLARQNDTVRKYRGSIVGSSELIDGIPLFGAKEELDNRKSLPERLQSFRDSLSDFAGKSGGLLKGILSKLSELVERLKTYIESKVAQVKELVDVSQADNRIAGYLPLQIDLATP
jgi:hypothetical protein